MLPIYVGVDISDRLTPFFLLRFRFRFFLFSAHRSGGGGEQVNWTFAICACNGKKVRKKRGGGSEDEKREMKTGGKGIDGKE